MDQKDNSLNSSTNVADVETNVVANTTHVETNASDTSSDAADTRATENPMEAVLAELAEMKRQIKELKSKEAENYALVVSDNNQQIALAKQELRTMIVGTCTQVRDQLVGYINDEIVPAMKNAVDYFNYKTEDGCDTVTEFRHETTIAQLKKDAEEGIGNTFLDTGAISSFVKLGFAENTTNI